KALLHKHLAEFCSRLALHFTRGFQLLVVDFAVMQQDLAQVLARIVGLRPNNHSALEVDLLSDLPEIELQRSRLAAGTQKLEQVGQAHCFQSAFNCHWLSCWTICARAAT